MENRFIGKSGKSIVDADKAADIIVPTFIYNISKETSACDIKGYIKSSANQDVTIGKDKYETAKEYEVFVPKSKLKLFLDEHFWPTGILYRRFVDFSRASLIRRHRENASHKSSNRRKYYLG